MRILILMVGTLLAATAFAESDFKVNRLELSAAAVDATEETAEVKEEVEKPQTKAQDYNSSRSNRTVHAKSSQAQDYNSSRSNTTAAIDTDDDGDSVPTEDACTNAVDNDCTGTTDDAEPVKATSRK